MRKKLVIMLAGLLTVLSMGFGAAQFSDVPAGHWAQEAVEAITGRGIIVGFPDGTFRGNENLTRYQAALIIYRLLQQLEAEKGTGPATDAVQGMTDEEKAALQNAIQELAAELAALGVRVSALEDNAATKDDVAALQAQLDELKAGMAPADAGAGALDQQALQDLADRVEAASVAADTALAQSQELGERLDAVEGDLAALRSEIEAGSDSISALNELAVLLNQDVLSLQDRVTAIEKAIADIQGQEGPDLTQFATLEDVAALQEFASALRTDLVALSEKVSALETSVAGIDKRVAALEANRFTMSGSLSVRYGYRSTVPGGSNFDSTRAIDTIFDDDTGGVDAPDFSTSADTRLDTRANFTVRKAITGSGLEVSEATVTLRWFFGGDIYADDDTLRLHAFNLKGAVDGQDFTFRYDRNNLFKFTEYVFDNNNPDTGVGLGRGVLGTFNLSKGFLSPTVTVAAGSTSIDGTAGTNDYWGIRTVIKPFGVNLGVNYAQSNVRNLATPGLQVFGVDANTKLFGLVDLSTEYAIQSSVSNGFDFTDPDGAGPALADPQIFYVKAGVGIGPITLNANYRATDPNWNGISNNGNDRPFSLGQRGFGVDVSATLGFLRLGGYFDSRTNFYEDPGTDQRAFGANVGANLFAGLSLNAYYNNTTLAGVTQYAGADYDSATGKFGTNFGVKVGAKDLILTGLELGFEYRSSASNGGALGDFSDLIFAAKAPLNLAGFSITPNVRYHSFGSNVGGTESYSTLKYGVQLTTPTLNLFIINPSLEVGYAARTTTPATSPVVSESRWSVGVKLADFLLPKGTFGVAYASYTGNNVTSMIVGTDDKLYDNGNDRLYSTPGTDYGPVAFGSTAVGTLTGIYLNYTYYGLGLYYGSFVLDLDNNGTADSTGYGFRVSYTFSF
ncbi:S-layer protein SlpA [Calidithermus terrae]|uniref:S-layer protein SlpA n=1 Tax=Calidithermus terrae TaxID=1408545 RepID=A0A399EEQ8_9DEIN|nr:S-layer homology domain-containing protein [Calidithermus terrae]RIH82815.1 S-layer protein SlpA [Calidithermus terrae]